MSTDKYPCIFSHKMELLFMYFMLSHRIRCMYLIDRIFHTCYKIDNIVIDYELGQKQKVKTKRT